MNHQSGEYEEHANDFVAGENKEPEIAAQAVQDLSIDSQTPTK
jgi:hypothetical protein